MRQIKLLPIGTKVLNSNIAPTESLCEELLEYYDCDIAESILSWAARNSLTTAQESAIANTHKKWVADTANGINRDKYYQAFDFQEGIMKGTLMIPMHVPETSVVLSKEVVELLKRLPLRNYLSEEAYKKVVSELYKEEQMTSKQSGYIKGLLDKVDKLEESNKEMKAILKEMLND